MEIRFDRCTDDYTGLGRPGVWFLEAKTGERKLAARKVLSLLWPLGYVPRGAGSLLPLPPWLQAVAQRTPQLPPPLHSVGRLRLDGSPMVCKTGCSECRCTVFLHQSSPMSCSMQIKLPSANATTCLSTHSSGDRLKTRAASASCKPSLLFPCSIPCFSRPYRILAQAQQGGCPIGPRDTFFGCEYGALPVPWRAYKLTL